jgi:hypothetical protein
MVYGPAGLNHTAQIPEADFCFSARPEEVPALEPAIHHDAAEHGKADITAKPVLPVHLAAYTPHRP